MLVVPIRGAQCTAAAQAPNPQCIESDHWSIQPFRFESSLGQLECSMQPFGRGRSLTPKTEKPRSLSHRSPSIRKPNLAVSRLLDTADGCSTDATADSEDRSIKDSRWTVHSNTNPRFHLPNCRSFTHTISRKTLKDRRHSIPSPTLYLSALFLTPLLSFLVRFLSSSAHVHSSS